ncbi:thiol-disulfide isomerase/thioredoxin [Bosea sp. BE271]|uniref:redoxin domain-containing protein n=1 Tax=Bosea TaxID=85413 RepID=UPI00285CAC73|nr:MULTISPECIES: redoxin domain-containing protein [Bosea]MDR6830746.1 thiol-disulfide isomerase/thioredoxin [Bosea robiniae]MDR6895403.1 thiol-disulfide isomerase/thioredoxin [Bosea sp. BE109]MDR7138799.1 thiol-disulfide isomerase/thioredoxin [Bosea sp. BE168]MDR7175500.1 thiol-disulfide isomerase/thioredoxin [Bosea sp. BE271]
MGLEQELAAFRADFIRIASQGRVALYEAKLRISFAQGRAIDVGDEAPGFDLPGINGSRVVLDDLLRLGPVVLTFYRGGWCPYCNLQLRAYQAALLDRASRVREGAEDALAPLPNLKRQFETIDARPAVARARAGGQDHAFKQVRDEEAKRALFPSNYPPAA